MQSINSENHTNISNWSKLYIYNIPGKYMYAPGALYTCPGGKD